MNSKIVFKNKWLLTLLFLFFLVLIFTSYDYSLAETSEARYAEISREMVLTKDFLHPQLLGIYHYHKPPMTYWLTAFGYSLFGINEFGSRFFLQLSILIQIILVFFLGKLLFNDKKTATFSALAYISLPIVLISSRNLTTDAYLTTFIISTIFFWLNFIKKRKIYYLYAFYISIGLTMLTKGPVGLIFILTFILFYHKIIGVKFRRTIHHLFGIIICLLISSSWYILVIYENPKLLDYFVFDQIGNRIYKQSYHRGKPFWYFIPMILGMLLPWMISALINRKNQIKNLKIKHPFEKILIYTAFTLLVIFSLFKTKLLLYILPIFWMLAIYIGHQLTKFTTKELKSISGVFLGFAFVFLAIPIFSIIFSTSIQINTSILYVVLLLISIVLILLFITRKNYFNFFVCSILSFSSTLLIVAQLVLHQNPHLSNSVSNEIKKINSLNGSKEGGIILVYNYLLSSAPFYTDLDVITLHFDYYTSKRETQFQNDNEWKNNYLDLKNKQDKIKFQNILKKDNIYLLVRKRRQINSNHQNIFKGFDNRIDFPNWILFYND